MPVKGKNHWMPFFWVAVLAVLFLAVRMYRQHDVSERPPEPALFHKESRGLNRNPIRILYSKHAQCRMECRFIDSSEVRQILREGTINYKKSEIGNRPDCKRKYAIEGITRDQQRVRIIFAPCRDTITVVTVIDIGREWPCPCNEQSKGINPGR